MVALDDPDPSRLSGDPAISPLLSSRRSTRAFDPHTPLTDATLVALVEAARSAPSAYNHQPWRLWIARRGTAEFDRLIAALEPYNALWAHRAGALIVSILVERSHGSEYPWAQYDLGQAVALLTVEATRRGIGVCQMAGRDDRAIGQIVEAGDGESVAIVTAVGFAGDTVELEPDTAALERNAARRRPLTEVATIYG